MHFISPTILGSMRRIVVQRDSFFLAVGRPGNITCMVLETELDVVAESKIAVLASNPPYQGASFAVDLVDCVGVPS
jgi:hypothetical protein